MLKEIERNVSVPTRGLLIPNFAKWDLVNDEILVSVPTRGLLIPNGSS